MIGKTTGNDDVVLSYDDIDDVRREVDRRLSNSVDKLKRRTGADVHHNIGNYSKLVIAFLDKVEYFCFEDLDSEALEFRYHDLWQMGLRLEEVRKWLTDHGVADDELSSDLRELVDNIVRVLFPVKDFDESLEYACVMFDTDLVESLILVENQLRRILAMREKPLSVAG